MWEIIYLLLMAVFVAAAIVAVALIWRTYIERGGPGANMFKPKVEKRLEVLDQAMLDGRRKLVIIRRDDKEHLIMTGGPVDVVIETGIESRRTPRSVSDGMAPTMMGGRQRTTQSVDSDA